MQHNEQIFRLPSARMPRSFVRWLRPRTEEVVPSLLELADRFGALADQQDTRHMA